MCLDLIRERITSSMHTYVCFCSGSPYMTPYFFVFLLSTCTAGPKASLLSICEHDLPPGVCGLRMNRWHFFSREQMFIDFSNPSVTSAGTSYYSNQSLSTSATEGTHMLFETQISCITCLPGMDKGPSWLLDCVSFQLIQACRRCKRVGKGVALLNCSNGCYSR